MASGRRQLGADGHVNESSKYRESTGRQEMDVRKEWVGLKSHLVNIDFDFAWFLGFVSMGSVAT